MLPVQQTNSGISLYSVLYSMLKVRSSYYFNKWHDHISLMKEIEEKENAANSLSQAKQIMKKSVRGQRTMVEQEALAKVLSTISCLPKMSSGDMDLLTNNIECLDCSGRTLIFLQGDFGACFYIIATGNIELYLEPSKDTEMSNCRNFGVFRGQHFDVEKCGALGRHIVTLKAGQGFGEYAILSSTHKFRGATAVAAEEDSTLLFIVNADTYNATLRKHHFRQQQMSSALALLKELPIFNFQSPAKISQFAYNLRCQTYSPRTVIARANTTINTLFLISTGSIKVVANSSVPSSSSSDADYLSSVIRRPDLCALEFGRGQIIGLWEVLKDLPTYEMTYITSASCELLEISHQYFQEVMSASKKLPVNPGKILATAGPSSTKDDRNPPIFTTSSRKGYSVPRREASSKPPVPPTETFFSTILRASDDREHLHCERVDRVKKSLNRVKESRGGAESDLRSIIPRLFSDTSEAAEDMHEQSLSSEGDKQRRNSGSIADVLPSKSCAGLMPGKGSIVQQYQNAVYHSTKSSTTSVICISSSKQTKEVNLSSNFVKSELSAPSASTSLPSHPKLQHMNSPMNDSPNRKRRTVSLKNALNK